ncbi:SET domain-containing protein-lysine N-methyltransferase [Luteimonas sp. 8-5]|uniref:SET domain-containing protein-lysine N-methyltransferase n=1 Tax=Luteimonas sp. 8-5 TaxID=3039387 RepID=UPI0024372614|nr:SET domain-containing protein-lysine N-methyltransferase [Luteimonas sp. 8-5]MDG6348576.1 SET domain-containing protein-lysine N-methyltransferase [Luteimonas sp. 8-5]
MVRIAAPIAYIADTGTAKGRGVFASRKISSGEIVEVCPVVVLSSRWKQMPPEVQRVVFDWGYLTKQEAASCLALGWGSMYNHANPASLRYVAVADAFVMQFVAARDIDADEELTINYNETGGDISSTEDVWFKDSGVTPII